MTKINRKKFPKISIVTPNFNYGKYLEDTIVSVLSQEYPNLEYILIDGGSTDNSVDVIRTYEDRISSWQSKRDDGQADAINKGFLKTTGDILGWLNSDDMYLPGALNKVRNIFASLEGDDPTIVFGNCVHLDVESNRASGSDVVAWQRALDLRLYDYIIQPSCFWSRSVYERVGPLSLDMNFGFDWDWFIRAEQAGVRFVSMDDFLSVYRFHDEHKTGIGGEQRWQELAEIYRKHYSGEVADSFLKLKHNQLVRWTAR